MFIDRFHLPLPGKAGTGLRIAALALGTALATCLPIAGAQATDLDFTGTTAPAADGNYLRIGLNKTAVIKLPAAVKDVVVGDPAVVDVVIRNRNTAYLFARTPQQTNVFFFDANGQEVLHLDLEVTLDSKGLKKLIDRTMPGNSINVDTTGQNIVLKGTAANAAEAKLAEDLATRVAGNEVNVVNAMKIAEGDQVMLKVKVVELKRTILKQLGIDLNAQFSVGAFDFGYSTAGLDAAAETVWDGVASYSSGGMSADFELKALEKEGLATTLAEPTLTAISGAAARFHAGGQFPYTACTGTGADRSCSVEFKDYGISLDFTPTVLSEGRIGLNIRTEVSDLADIAVGGEPAIDTRSAQTSVEIPSGGSMMLAGLIKDITSQDLRGTPGLRKIPILGTLFNSRAYQKNQSELVVIVTPYIVNPTGEQALATPIDGFNPPTDRQGIFFGRLNKVYGTPGKHPKGVYHGKIGYIIE